MTQTTQTIDLAKVIDREGFNPRDEIQKKELDSLTRSIQTHGLLQPIIVKPVGEGYVLIDGHRRAAACAAAGVFDVLAIVRTDEETEADQLVKAVVVNQQRVGLNPVEEAKAFGRLKGEGRNARQIASELSISEKIVKERLALLELPDEVLPFVASGSLPLGALATIASIAKVSPEAALEVAKTAQEYERTAGQINEHPLYGSQSEAGASWAIFTRDVGPDHCQPTAEQRKAMDEVGKLKGYSYTPHLHPLLEEAVKIGIGWHSGSDADKSVLIADLGWLSEAIDRQTAAERKRAEKQLAERVKAGNVPQGMVSDGAGGIREADEDEAKDLRREKREQERRDQANARGANHALGVSLYGKTKLRPVDRDMALQIAWLVIGPEHKEIAQAGPAQCQEQYLQRPEKENGAYDFLYQKAEEDLWGFIAQGQTADEVFQMLAIVLAQADCSNLGSLPQSRQVTRPSLLDRAGAFARWYCQEALPAETRVRKLDAPGPKKLGESEES